MEPEKTPNRNWEVIQKLNLASWGLFNRVKFQDFTQPMMAIKTKFCPDLVEWSAHHSPYSAAVTVHVVFFHDNANVNSTIDRAKVFKI